MKLERISFIAILLIVQGQCFAQQRIEEGGARTVLHKSPAESAFLVLKLDNKSLEISRSEDINMESFDKHSIESISVLKDKAAMDTYGEKGRNGVVIITFKDYSLLSKDLQRRFTEAEQ